MLPRTFLSSVFKAYTLALLAAPFICGSTAMATTSKPLYTEDSKKAATDYAADRKLCAEESSSDARLQCRRDAKTVYDRTQANAKSKIPATNIPSPVNGACPQCGRVVAVSIVDKEGEGGAVGIIAGGVGGAILGHQVGGGVGKDLATIAGAAGGAYAGKKIEGKVRSHKVWNVSVQYPDKSKKHFEFKEDPGYRVGDTVKNSGASIARH